MPSTSRSMASAWRRCASAAAGLPRSRSRAPRVLCAAATSRGWGAGRGGPQRVLWAELRLADAERLLVEIGGLAVLATVLVHEGQVAEGGADRPVCGAQGRPAG